MTTGQERPTNNRTESRHGYFNSLSRDVHPFPNRHHLSPQIRPSPASLEVAVSEMLRWASVNTYGLARSQELFLAGRGCLGVLQFRRMAGNIRFKDEGSVLGC
jgi:hypothetical protein